MTIPRKGVLSLAAPLVLALGAPALADATIDTDLAVSVKKGTKFIVEADVSMATSGTVTLSGTVAGTPFEQTKKFKTKKQATKTVKVGVVELFLPSYAFALIPTSPTTTAVVDLPTLTGLTGTPQAPILAGLNAVNPEPGTTYHALY